MLARSLCIVALAGCFTSRTAADHSRTTTYNVATAVGGVAAAMLGFEIIRAGVNTDGLGPPLAVMVGGSGLAAGAFMTIGGIAGVVLTELGYTPTHRF
jgi:hypothetical protein